MGLREDLQQLRAGSEMVSAFSSNPEAVRYAKMIAGEITEMLAANPEPGYVVERTDFSSSFERWKTVAQFAEYADAREYMLHRVTINQHGAEVCRYRMRAAGVSMPGSEGW